MPLPLVVTLVQAFRCSNVSDSKDMWAENIKSQAKQEMISAKEREKTTLLVGQPDHETAKDFEELMHIIRSAEEKGKIRITRRPSIIGDHELQSQEQDVHELISLVKSASQMGNIRILRRKSTDRVKVTKDGTLTFGK